LGKSMNDSESENAKHPARCQGGVCKDCRVNRMKATT
jgi:ferredoxin